MYADAHRRLEGRRVAAAREVIASTAGAEPGLSRINALACRLLQVSETQLTVVSGDRQVVIARHGPDDGAEGRIQTALSGSVCPCVVDRREPVLIDDADAEDDAPGAAAARAAGFRAYAGVPVLDAEGNAVGAFCAVEREPRTWTELEVDVLRECAALAGEALRVHQRTQAATSVDPLTGLMTEDMLLQAIEHPAAGRGGPILAIGVDHLGMLNDAHGFAAGDALLAAMAERLRDAVRGGASVARAAGDVFLVALHGVASTSSIDTEALRLQQELSREPYRLGDLVQRMTVKIGIGHGASGLTPAQLVDRALSALRHAKARADGRRRPASADLATSARHRLTLQTELAGAVGRDELAVVYQPVVELTTGRTLGVEALLRWRHPVLGDVSPNDFIPVAEASGLIVDLGDWVLERACEDVARWRATPGWETFEVAVNVAPLQLAMTGFAEAVDGALHRHGLPGRALILEITERTLLQEGDRQQLAVRQLREQGVRIAIDDFGTGYSALSMLLKTPADILKLDRSFVDAMLTEPRAGSVVGAVIGMATGLHMRAVAEGIETDEQRDRLVDAGFRVGQGYRFARPMSPERLQEHLSSAVSPAQN